MPLFTREHVGGNTQREREQEARDQPIRRKKRSKRAPSAGARTRARARKRERESAAPAAVFSRELLYIRGYVLDAQTTFSRNDRIEKKSPSDVRSRDTTESVKLAIEAILCGLRA